MKTEIIIENLSKHYGKKWALNNVSLHIETGMFGLLGRNGAGKTTLMRILATILNKSNGNISVCGFDIDNAKKVRKLTGYLPQEFSMYPNMKVYEAMDYLGVLSDLPNNLRHERIPALLRKLNLDDCHKVKVKALSGGMKRRLGIAQAILHDPKVLIVDEPTAGLDPEERVRFRNLLCEIAENRIVILSTHIVEDIEKTCNKIAVLDKGEIIFNGLLSAFIAEEKNLEDAYIKQMGGRE
jgi:ABC-2 type transport system ATP-binding protein